MKKWTVMEAVYENGGIFYFYFLMVNFFEII